MDAREAMERILSDPRAGAGGRFEGGHLPAVISGARVYEDEPILRTGTQLAADRARPIGARPRGDVGAPRQDVRPSRAGTRAPAIVAPESPVARSVGGAMRVEPPRRRTGAWEADFESDLLRASQTDINMPEPYRMAREFARGPEARRHSEAWVFRRQAEMLADVTDDAPYDGRFERYFPVYQAMTDRQLRGYVTWRTRVRTGEVERTSTSFAFVYIYELLAGVGAPTPEEGFRALLDFWTRYREFDPAVDRHGRRWLRDYAVYHGLPLEALRGLPSVQMEMAFDASLLTMLHREGRSLEELFSAVSSLSTYRIRSSRLAKELPDDVRAVVLGVVARLEQHYARRRKAGLWESLFGRLTSVPYQMFEAAVFCEDEPHPDGAYELDEVNRYECRDGMWTSLRFGGSRGPSAELGVALKATDALMRERLGYPHPLRMPPKVPKYLLGYITQEVEARLAWKAAHEPRRIDIDLSKLGGIRAAAAETRDELLVDEERGEGAGFGEEEPRGAEEAARPVPAGSGAEPPASPEGPAASPAGLTSQQRAFLRGLLAGSADLPPGPVASLDMLVDAVNERLFDELGDTVVEFGPDGPALIEDYREDVRGIVAP